MALVGKLTHGQASATGVDPLPTPATGCRGSFYAASSRQAVPGGICEHGFCRTKVPPHIAPSCLILEAA